MAGHPLRPATRRRLGGPLPPQLADRPRAPPVAPSVARQLCYLSHAREAPYAVLPGRWAGYPPPRGKVAHVLRTRSPVTCELPPKCPRLACVKHAASVRPEPGSNSPIVSSDHSSCSRKNTVTLFYDSVSESRNCSDLNSPPHPERRRIDEFASHNLTLRSQLSNSMVQ